MRSSHWRIKGSGVFHKENGGSSSARNLGIEKATGDFIGFVDSDDYIEPEMYERLLAMLLEENLLVAQCSRDEIDEQGNRMPDVCTPPEAQVLVESEDFLRELLMHRGDCSFCTKLVEASLLKQHHFPEGELNEDFRLLVSASGNPGDRHSAGARSIMSFTVMAVIQGQGIGKNSRGYLRILSIMQIVWKHW